MGSTSYPRGKPLYLNYGPWDLSPRAGRSRHAGGDIPSAYFCHWGQVTHSAEVSLSLRDLGGSQGTEPCPPILPQHTSPLQGNPYSQRAHTKTGQCEEKAKGSVSLREVRRKGAVPQPPHSLPLRAGLPPSSPVAPRRRHGLFFPDRCPLGDQSLPPTPHRCRLPASQHPCSPTAPTGEVTLTHFSARREPALLPRRPALLHRKLMQIATILLLCW